jgi:hypothetical protein
MLTVIAVATGGIVVHPEASDTPILFSGKQLFAPC